MDGRDVRSGLDGPAHGTGSPGWSGRDEDLDVLCSAPLLDGLDPQDVAALLPAFRFATVDTDQELLTHGESGGAQMLVRCILPTETRRSSEVRPVRHPRDLDHLGHDPLTRSTGDVSFVDREPVTLVRLRARCAVRCTPAVVVTTGRCRCGR